MFLFKRFNLRRWGALTSIFLLAIGLAACGDAGSNNGTSDTADSGELDTEIEVAGTYTTEFGEEIITSEEWNGYPVTEWDNAENFAVTQSTADESFSKLVWIEPAEDGSFYYCVVEFGVETAEAAKNTDKEADPADPDNAGCGSFPWTKLTPQ